MRGFNYFSMSVICSFLLVSCVTINIYFPAAAAEQAADKIIEDVWGQPDNAKQSQQLNIDTLSLSIDKSWSVALLDWLIPTASAQANLNINSSAINRLQQQMQQRHQKLKPFYQTGVVGLTEKGFVAIRDIKAVSLNQRNQLKSLVSSENQDRLALYKEIARANGHPEWQAEIQATFARRWIDKAALGWWFQRQGTWQQK